ncbi:adenosine deaminase [Streptomyces sp. DH12]|uniref:adenosine deaminase family protein n=1 Tax=Streptomyces sp. DH12 TaxID=2857010 RepID=UPI001E3DFDDC|nr:adenosine deaminase [Streptomyces sp. DH12]
MRARVRIRARTLLAATLGAVALLPLSPPGVGAAAPPPLQRPAHVRPLTPGEAGTLRYLVAVRDEPSLLRDFFRRLPKGADLHHHLAGAVRTEYLLRLAAEDGLCVDTTMTALPPPCGPGTRPASDARHDSAFRDAVVRAWSMQDFPPGGDGHGHFFATFGKFAEVVRRHRGKQLAQVADEVVAQNQFALETMVTPVPEGAEELAARTGWDGDPARTHRRLLAGGGLDALVAAARAEADEADAEFRAEARCATRRPAPGCRLPVRWIAHVLRGGPPALVFTQMALGMRLAESDPRFVAVNLVQPEDGDVALRDHDLHLRMLAHLRGAYPGAHLTLHAGELWPGLVDPRHLRSHIRQAVTVARAERVGHGVDLRHEDDWRDTARTMAAREVAVEIPFTSNAQILGVRGADHPFATYRRFGVPVVLATDDPGVSRTDISREYQYAAETYGLSYPELKDLARASLEYAFLPGRSLWRGNPTRDGYHRVPACGASRPGGAQPADACRALLAASPKAAVQWRQEVAFHRFESLARTSARVPAA